MKNHLKSKEIKNISLKKYTLSDGFSNESLFLKIIRTSTLKYFLNKSLLHMLFPF